MYIRSDAQNEVVTPHTVNPVYYKNNTKVYIIENIYALPFTQIVKCDREDRTTISSFWICPIPFHYNDHIWDNLFTFLQNRKHHTYDDNMREEIEVLSYIFENFPFPLRWASFSEVNSALLLGILYGENDFYLAADSTIPTKPIL